MLLSPGILKVFDMANNTKQIAKLGVFTLAIMNVTAVVSLRGLPAEAEYGLSSAFYYLFAALVFLIPTSLVAAELAAMFNLTTVQYQQGSEITGNAVGQRILGYVVDNDGRIDFPVLGVLDVAGLTRWELSELIKKQLLDKQYLTDAVVTVEFMNFKISVLGEVTSPGTYNIQGDKVTVLQAISMAHDLTIYGERKNVSIIRERDGERTIYEIDLTDVDLFKSPAYYLQQNDIVYVQPNKYKKRQSTVDSKGQWVTSIALSAGSMLLTVVSIITNFILMQTYL